MRWTECTAAAYQDPPSPRLGHTAVLVDARNSWGEELLVIYGGLNRDKQPLDGLSVLQTASEAWFQPTTANEGPPPRAFHCAAAIGSCVYVFGGHLFLKERQGMQKFNDLWCLNTDNWEWNEVLLHPDCPVPRPRDFLDMVALPDEKLLIFGGLEANEKRSDETWIFDCKARLWIELELPLPRPKPRYAHALCRVDQRVLLCGGGDNATTMLNDLWILRGVVTEEDAGPCWAPLDLPGPGPCPRKGHSIAAAGWQVIVFGGHASELGWFRNKTDHYFNDVALLQRQGKVQWETAAVEGNIPLGREFHTLTAISPSRLLLFGGGNGKSIFSDAWWLQLDDFALPIAPTEPPAAEDEQSALEQARQGVPAEALGSSEADLGAELSIGWEQSLIGSADLVALQEQPTVASSLGASTCQSSQAQYGSLWWAGSPDAVKLGSLLQRLQVLPNPSALIGRADERTAFQQLGDRLCQERQGSKGGPVGRLHPEEAARRYLINLPAEGLRLRDVSALMWDYRSSAAVKHQEPEGAPSLAAALERLAQADCQRFSHMQARDLRLGDFAALHAEYKAKLRGSPDL